MNLSDHQTSQNLLGLQKERRHPFWRGPGCRRFATRIQSDQQGRDGLLKSPVAERSRMSKRARTLERTKTQEWTKTLDCGKAPMAQTLHTPAPDCMIVEEWGHPCRLCQVGSGGLLQPHVAGTGRGRRRAIICPGRVPARRRKYKRRSILAWKTNFGRGFQQQRNQRVK